MKPTALRSSFSYICLRSTFPLHFYLDLLNQKYFAALYFICDLLFQSTTNFWHCYPKGIDNPFNTSGCEVLLFVCRCCLRCDCLVLLLVRYLGFITERNNYHCCATSSSPLGGNTDTVLATPSSRISDAVPGEDLQHNQVPNQKSHLLIIYIIFHLPLVFLSPTSQKMLFYSPSFSFVVLLPDLFLCAFLSDFGFRQNP